MTRRHGWDYAQLKSTFPGDDEFLFLRGCARNDALFLGAIGLWSLCLARAWERDDPNVASLLVHWPERTRDLLVRAKLLTEDGELVGFVKWTEQARKERETWATRAAMNANKKLTRAIRERDGDNCRYCGQEVNWSDRRSRSGGTYDHVLPMDQGGGESVENLVVACRDCNLRKGARTPDKAGMPLLPEPVQTPIRINPVSSGSRQTNPDLDIREIDRREEKNLSVRQSREAEEDAALTTYQRLVVRVNRNALRWLDRLISEYGDDPTARAIGVASKDGTHDLLSRAETVLAVANRQPGPEKPRGETREAKQARYRDALAAGQISQAEYEAEFGPLLAVVGAEAF